MDLVDRHLVYFYMLRVLMRVTIPHSTGNPLLAREVPLLYARDVADIEKHWGWDIKQIEAATVRSSVPPMRWREVVPATLGTVERTYPLFWQLVIDELKQKFDLFRIPGFYFWDGSWRINIPDDTHFLMPYRDDNNLILGIKLYRSASCAPTLLHSTGLTYGAKAVTTAR